MAAPGNMNPPPHHHHLTTPSTRGDRPRGSKWPSKPLSRPSQARPRPHSKHCSLAQQQAARAGGDTFTILSFPTRPTAPPAHPLTHTHSHLFPPNTLSFICCYTCLMHLCDWPLPDYLKPVE